MALLIVEHHGTRRMAPLARRILIGRRAGNHVVINDRAVSMVHAWIDKRGEECVLTDTGSRTGTLVNGKRITRPLPLVDGDVITVGPATLTFHANGDAEAREEAPPVRAIAVETPPPSAAPPAAPIPSAAIPSPVAPPPAPAPAQRVESSADGWLFDCACGAPLWAGASFAGRTAYCRYCGREVRVPDAATVAAEAPVETPPTLVEAAPPPPIAVPSAPVEEPQTPEHKETVESVVAAFAATAAIDTPVVQEAAPPEPEPVAEESSAQHIAETAMAEPAPFVAGEAIEQPLAEPVAEEAQSDPSPTPATAEEPAEVTPGLAPPTAEVLPDAAPVHATEADASESPVSDEIAAPLTAASETAATVDATLPVHPARPGEGSTEPSSEEPANASDGAMVAESSVAEHDATTGETAAVAAPESEPVAATAPAESPAETSDSSVAATEPVAPDSVADHGSPQALDDLLSPPPVAAAEPEPAPLDDSASVASEEHVHAVDAAPSIPAEAPPAASTPSEVETPAAAELVSSTETGESVDTIATSKSVRESEPAVAPAIVSVAEPTSEAAPIAADEPGPTPEPAVPSQSLFARSAIFAETPPAAPEAVPEPAATPASEPIPEPVAVAEAEAPPPAATTAVGLPEPVVSSEQAVAPTPAVVEPKQPEPADIPTPQPAIAEAPAIPAPTLPSPAIPSPTVAATVAVASAAKPAAAPIPSRGRIAPPPARPGKFTPLKASRTCGICQSGILFNEKTTTCPSCGLTFHTDCWTENRGCSAYGCPQVGILDAKKPGAAGEHAHDDEHGDDHDAAVAAQAAAVEREAGLSYEVKAPFPWEFATLAASAVSLLLSALTFGVPSFVVGAATMVYLSRKPGVRRKTGVLLLSTFIALIGFVGGVMASWFWYFGSGTGGGSRP